MQTFLPYKSFKKTMKVLDWRRLGKQRVEAKQILNILMNRTEKMGWRNHPIVKMWSGYEEALQLYFNDCVEEWIRRGYRNNMLMEDIIRPIIYPEWLGDKEFHSSHRANLLRKDEGFYSQWNWLEDKSNPYNWLDTDKNQWYEQHVGTGVREYIG